MKEEKVLVDCKAHQFVIYAEKDDGSFSPVQTGSYMTKNHIDDFFQIAGNVNNSLIEKLKKGEISPLHYFMGVEGLTVADLAARVGISKYYVKKHLEPNGFQKVTVSQLRRYANVLNIPLANLFQIIITKEDKIWNPGFQEEAAKSESFLISQVKTDNPLLVETKIVQNTK